MYWGTRGRLIRLGSEKLGQVQSTKKGWQQETLRNRKAVTGVGTGALLNDFGRRPAVSSRSTETLVNKRVPRRKHGTYTGAIVSSTKNRNRVSSFRKRGLDEHCAHRVAAAEASNRASDAELRLLGCLARTSCYLCCSVCSVVSMCTAATRRTKVQHGKNERSPRG